VRSGRDWFAGHARGIGDDGELLLETGAGDLITIVSAEEIRRE
jgi:biotin-(acetyl-CoA carboxylase) ligase